MLTLGDLVDEFGREKIVISCLTEDDVDELIESGGKPFTDEMREKVISMGFDSISGIEELEDIYHGVYCLMSKEGKERMRCNECGDSVRWGSGKAVNRVMDFNDVETRKEMGKPFPKGNFVCGECDMKRCGDKG